ncbi:MAG: hypothetical protein C0591_08995 [Marinilabiliales bacterium]|nr:MAG: hypothetical protein C0591_08995 [Marinilabiliales bacterium]
MTKYSSELNSVMKSLGLNHESKLFRYTSRSHINRDQHENEYIKAKKDPHEMIVDTYEGRGHTYMAKQVGSGLAFVIEKVTELESTERVCCEVSLKNILDQGGLVYRVVSQPSYINAIFCTLPLVKVDIDKY